MPRAGPAHNAGMDGPEASKTLRENRAGALSAGGIVAPVGFIIDGATGRIVIPLPRTTAGAEFVLFVPEESDDALQALLHDPMDASEEMCDRWRAYHGTPRTAKWGSFSIESARLGGAVIDGGALRLVNALRASEAALCRRANADRAALTRVCERLAGVAVAEPVCVGVDAFGLDVRARFGIVRVPFDGEVAAESAPGALERLLSGRRP